MIQPAPATDVLAEARRLHGRAEAAGITARLLGGAAVALSAGGPLPAVLQRPYKDLDYVVRRADAPGWRELLETSGYTADTQFNVLHGAQRMLHYDPVNGRQLDTFVSTFAMCHALELEDRLPAGSATLAPADILLTKLQIFEVNDKDLTDSIALLLSHPVTADGAPATADGPAGIAADRLAEVTRTDWGWHTTLTDNLAKVAQRLPTAGLSRIQAGLVAQRMEQITEALASAPKSLRWRARAKIGRRVPWYDLPEEVE
jgi:Uncharacterised nucleotidyltransferase